MLTRRNADIAALYGELTARDVPVEIVGLGGLLQLPEVMDVTATLRLLDDVTANADLVRLLTGPRWRIGPARPGPARPTGARAGRSVARARWSPSAESRRRAARRLEEAVADVDPTEVVSLLDACERPGELPYSAAARQRFARLRGRAGAAAPAQRRAGARPCPPGDRPARARRRADGHPRARPGPTGATSSAAFFDAVADYADVDGDASLSGLLAYLQAEIDQGAGLEQAVPSDREAVKLLTVHRAKGLEWEVVCLPALMRGVFPSDRVTDNWVTEPGRAARRPAGRRGGRSRS